MLGMRTNLLLGVCPMPSRDTTAGVCDTHAWQPGSPRPCRGWLLRGLPQLLGVGVSPRPFQRQRRCTDICTPQGAYCMPDLVSQSPLMAAVSYEGQTYYTSQFFHAQYMTNSDPAKAKYKRHHDFLRFLRSIEIFATLQRHEKIVRLAWKKTLGEAHWRPLFQAVGFQTMTIMTNFAYSELMQTIPRKRLQSSASEQYIYLVRHGDTQFFKLGISLNTRMRLVGLQSGNPIPLSLVGEWRVEDARKVEAELMQRLWEYHIRGEWFALDKRLEKEMKALLHEHAAQCTKKQHRFLTSRVS